MDADVSQKFDIVQLRQPVCIVEEKGLPSREVKETGELFLLSLSVLGDLFKAQNLAHFRFSAGVAHQSRSTPDQSNRLVAVLLHVREGHDGNQASHMKAGGCRVKPDVTGGPSF